VLAAALLPQPDLLLLDEPTVGLDPVATHEVHAYLRTMMHGRTTLLCTHNLHEAEALCDTVIILRGGRVLLHDRIEQLRVRTQPHVELAAVEGTEPLMHSLRSRGFVPEVRDGAVRIRLAEPRKQTPALLRDLLADGLQVYECHVITPSLEDVFLEIVGATDDGA
jgi:ABC-2 type transport system ATP-binding protein